jgi:very-short-patch-repair endonuclease
MALRINKVRGEFARKMRKEPTEPEKRLWRNLSNSQLGGFKFRRQTVIGPYICDFSCSWNGLIIEVDGETHDIDSDAERDAYLTQAGYHVFHVTNGDVMNNMDGVLQMILGHCERLPERRYAPTPTPPLEGRGF